MPISAGTRLSTYEVVTQIGAGGMGEVYKAHDTKLGRDVAIKILPEAFAHDSERLARFQREAKMLASLNHPNIATIHGLEHSNSTHYLVMELVSGETLAERIKRDGSLPVEEAPAFSPDGRWLAYESNESGSYEVYVRPFPGPGGKWQISTGGGQFPKWSRNGKELFYRIVGNKIMAVTYTASGDSFRADKPQLWSPGQFTGRGANSNFDLHPDGKRFAVLKSPSTEQAAAVNKVSLVFNFFDEIRRKVPPGK